MVKLAAGVIARVLCYRRQLFWLALMLFPTIATAKVSWEQEWGTRISSRQSVAPLTSDLFGEEVSLYDGTTSFVATDVSIPGNFDIPVAISRRAKLGVPGGSSPQELFGEWEIELPYLKGMYGDDPSSYWKTLGPDGNARCSVGVIPGWGSNALSLPGGGGGLLLKRIDTPKHVRPQQSGLAPWVTKSNWYFTCLPTIQSGQGGEGFVGIAPDGKRYYFDWMTVHNYPGTTTPAMKAGSQIPVPRKEIRLYPTKIEDRFGNKVEYRWTGRHLDSITSSDGRRIDLYYGSNDQVERVIAHGRTWNYAYATAARLQEVVNPDQSRWRYVNEIPSLIGYRDEYESYNCRDTGMVTCDWRLKLDQIMFCQWSDAIKSTPYTFEITAPSGASGKFTFQSMRHGRTNVPRECQVVNGEDGDAANDVRNWYNLYQPYQDVYSLVAKRVEGVALTPMQWFYQYGNLAPAYAELPYSPQYKTTTIVQPGGDLQVSVFGKDYGVNDGQLAAVETWRAGQLVRRVSHTYVSNDEIAALPFPDFMGYQITFDEGPDAWGATVIRPQRTTTIDQDGSTTNSIVDSYDALARPLNVTKFSSLGSSKTEGTGYLDDLTQWVLGQVATFTVNGIQVSRTDYDTNVLPWKNYTFGKLQSTMGYYADGTLAMVKDGRDLTTTLSSWKRGIPQSIAHPDTTNESAVVNDSGWITSVTDENGYSTGYGYDAMGRIASIAYPTGDATLWNTTTFTFAPVSGPEYGIPAGHWRQVVSTGNARKVTYFDAMWRPLVDESYDQGDVNTTLSQAVKRYDVSGHLVYQSYPLRFLSDYSVPTKGIRTSYDALDRATRVEQDSELGVLATSTEYLAGFQIRTTNPRLQSTTVSYLAYDQPSTEFPVAISHPEGAYTNILRNGLGKPTSLTRRNADSSVALTRYYVYDAQQQLCKTVEPETAATVMDYDAAGNLAWSASGLNTLSTTACDTESVPAAVKVTRTYDARNRLSTLLFPDGNGTQSWGYTPDGLPSVITTLNDEGLTSAVNGYTYNKRRLLTGESLRQPALSYTWALGYGYNGNGHMASHTSPGLTVDYAPNALGQPTQAGTYATGVSYFANGAMAQFTYGNGIVHTLVQNTRGLPDQSRDAYGGTAVHDDSYDFDANGNVLAISDALPGNRGNRDMTYDGLDRLTGTTSPMFGVASYGYDVLDNLKTLKVTGGTQARDNTYVYDASWRLTNVANTVGGSSVIGLGYDVQGNLANKNGQLYRFDFGNRLRDATGKEHYRYDGYGRRVQATHPTLGDIYSMYGSDGVLRYQHDYRTHKVSSYVYLNGSLVARVSDATPVVPPPILSAPTINSSGSFAVNWSAVEGANRYHLEESVNSGTWTQVVDTPGLSWSASGKPNGIYRYRARSCQMECSAFSTIATTTVDLMPTTVPTLSTPAYSTTGSFTVAWTAEALATRYELDEQVDGGSWTQIQNAAATSQAIGGKPSGSYGYRVRACNSTACAAWSATATVTVEMAPTVPPSLTVPAQGLNGAYVVSWSAVAGATSYTLQESADGGAWTTAYSGGAQSLALAGKVTGSYAYRVQACNLGGCSDVSASGTVQVIYPPASASTLSAPAQSTNGGYIVSWTTVATATSYQLEESSNGGAWTLSQNASSISSAFSSKAAGTYSYRVKACNAAGCGPTSAATSVQVIYQPVSSPVVSVPAQSTNGAYTVSWTAVATSASYQLEESVNGAAWALSQDAFAISAAYASKAAGSYSYRVKACNAAGCGPTSATASVQVIYPPSSAPTPTGPGQSSSAYTVSWTGVATATSYQLEENTNGGAWTLRQNAAATSMAFTGKAVATYGYRVKACNAAGCGPMSGTITVQVVSIPTAAPALTVPASSSTGTYTVSWTAITGATSYQFAERPQGGSWLLNQNVAGTTKAITQTTGTYEYKVTACNAAGCGPSSAIKSITVQLPGIPAIPAAPSVATGTYCTVSWGSMANTTSYRLIDANNSVGTFATTQVTAVCAAPYRVAACNANGCSAYSDPSVSDMQMMRRAP